MGMKEFHELCDAVARKLMNEGKLMEAGWHVYRTRIMPPDCSLVQIEETRRAFYCGAQHVFASINAALDEGEEPTEADLMRMDKLDDELQAFVAELESAGIIKQ